MMTDGPHGFTDISVIYAVFVDDIPLRSKLPVRAAGNIDREF